MFSTWIKNVTALSPSHFTASPHMHKKYTSFFVSVHWMSIQVNHSKKIRLLLHFSVVPFYDTNGLVVPRYTQSLNKTITVLEETVSDGTVFFLIRFTALYWSDSRFCRMIRNLWAVYITVLVMYNTKGVTIASPQSLTLIFLLKSPRPETSIGRFQVWKGRTQELHYLCATNNIHTFHHCFCRSIYLAHAISLRDKLLV